MCACVSLPARDGMKTAEQDPLACLGRCTRPVGGGHPCFLAPLMCHSQPSVASERFFCDEAGPVLASRITLQAQAQLPLGTL